MQRYLVETEELFYDKEQLLKEAMLYEGVKMSWLMEDMQMSEQEIFARLYGDGASEHIRNICKVLRIDQSYFTGGMQYEKGKLVRKQ